MRYTALFHKLQWLLSKEWSQHYRIFSSAEKVPKGESSITQAEMKSTTTYHPVITVSQRTEYRDYSDSHTIGWAGDIHRRLSTSGESRTDRLLWKYTHRIDWGLMCCFNIHIYCAWEGSLREKNRARKEWVHLWELMCLHRNSPVSVGGTKDSSRLVHILSYKSLHYWWH